MTPAVEGISAHAFTGALSAAANGVSIVTTSVDGRRAGLTVSSLCSVCAEPPLLLVCVNADNEFIALADRSERFVINILERRHATLAMRFAGMQPDGTPTAADDDRFEAGDWRDGHDGMPVLDDALIALECALESTLLRGTHRLFIGLVSAVTLGSGTPLVYTDRGFAIPQSLV